MDGKIIAVTGACGILGRAMIAELAARGAKPAAIDIAAGPAPAEASFAILGADISDPAAAEKAIADLVAQAGRIDGLVNIAGGFIWQTVGGGTSADWDRMYRMNLSTALSMSRAAVPKLVEAKGAIVNVGAAATAKAGAGMGAYTASKSAVARLTEALAEELKDEGVRVNAVLPSIIDTPTNRSDMPDAEHDRWVTPAALARVIAFLLSSQAAPITGALLPVTGRV